MIDIIDQQNDYLVVELNTPEANLSNADAFKTEMFALLDEHNKSLILNLDKVNYVDSSFLGGLVASLKHAIAIKKDIVLVGLKDDIKDLLMLIRLDKVFKIYDDAADAAQALQGE